ncbi:unnamed protein product [Polarella glacialis]|uniref:EF-hand domain-containing protein n=1 Tax=Polarella glacialis TaxID=89957 RepID=A0A813FTF9_POLGL|nr:unnamed protein product [Polarella glacialis]
MSSTSPTPCRGRQRSSSLGDIRANDIRNIYGPPPAVVPAVTFSSGLDHHHVWVHHHPDKLGDAQAKTGMTAALLAPQLLRLAAPLFRRQFVDAAPHSATALEAWNLRHGNGISPSPSTCHSPPLAVSPRPPCSFYSISPYSLSPVTSPFASAFNSPCPSLHDGSQGAGRLEDSREADQVWGQETCGRICRSRQGSVKSRKPINTQGAPRGADANCRRPSSAHDSQDTQALRSTDAHRRRPSSAQTLTPAVLTMSRPASPQPPSSHAAVASHASQRAAFAHKAALWKVADLAASPAASPATMPVSLHGPSLQVPAKGILQSKGDPGDSGWDPNALARSVSPLPTKTAVILSPTSQPAALNRGMRRQLTCGTEGGLSTMMGRSLSTASFSDLAEVCPRSPAEFLVRLTAEKDCFSFSRSEVALMKQAYHRFKNPEASDLDRSSLLDVFVHLGYLGPTEMLAANIDKIAAQVSTFVNFNFIELVEVAEKLCVEEAKRIPAAFEFKLASCKTARDNQRLPDSELPQLLQRLGFLPLNRVISEILHELRGGPELEFDEEENVSNENGTNEVDYTEQDLDLVGFNVFLATYRASEGFGREMLSLARGTFNAACAASLVTAPSTVAAALPSEAPKNTDEFSEADAAAQKPAQLLRPELLLGPLLRLFGRQSEQPARALLRHAGFCGDAAKQPKNQTQPESHHLVESAPDEYDLVPTEPPPHRVGISLAEFIIWARRLHKLRLTPLWQRFNTSAVLPAAGPQVKKTLGPLMPVASLAKAMQGVQPQSPKARKEPLKAEISSDGAVIAAAEAAMPGMTISCDVVAEFVAKAGLEEDKDLDFDGFVRFAECCCRRSGFGREESDELKVLFRKFDHNSSVELEAPELLDLLRYLGYDTCLEDVYRFIDSVDCNRNGTLDFQEFLRQMRLHREAEWCQIRKIFKQKLEQRKMTTTRFQDAMENSGLSPRSQPLQEEEQLLPCSQVQSALHALGVLPLGEEHLLAKLILEAGSPEALSLQDFATLEEKCRIESAAVRRRHAGFSSPELAVIRRLFNQHLKQQTSGVPVLGLGELLWLLSSVGVPVDTLEARKDILDLLEAAREAARKVGTAPEDIGEPGSKAVTFWALVHLLRAYRRRGEGTSAEKEQKALDDSRFSRAEVLEFREVFLTWASRAPPPRSAGPAGDGLGPLHGSRSTSAAAMAAELLLGSGTARAAWMSLLDIKALLCSLGLRYDLEHRKAILGQMETMFGRGAVGEWLELPASVIDFADFLRLMRWMLDSNFADINGAAKEVVSRKATVEAAAKHAKARKLMKGAAVAAKATKVFFKAAAGNKAGLAMLVTKVESVSEAEKLSTESCDPTMPMQLPKESWPLRMPSPLRKRATLIRQACKFELE